MTVSRYIKSVPFGDFPTWTEREFEALERAVSDLAVQGGESVPYAIKYDQDADPPATAYLGQAAPGSAGSLAVWRVQKLTFGGDGDVTATWADGNANFDNVWDNRASLSYS